eukprot:TRINITY_DN15725_c0_g1_i2.p1 TRINITY_DN15725_c0_g1~~TRINITY_DN15725_c0_g1_i2.p1  ORF type:complete len:390 (+),score=40.31 TRINITY_DN15725_c0_g1_i2:126-1295(+)
MKRWVGVLLLVQLCMVVMWGFAHHPRMLETTSLRPRTAVDRSRQIQHYTHDVVGQVRVEKNAKSAEEEGLKPGRHFPNETIFVALASYGDRECAPTISRAYQRAAYPDRVFFGVFQQHNCSNGDDTYCLDCTAALHDSLNCPGDVLCTRLWQVRISRLPMSSTLGVTYGRYMAEKHFRGETYVMNIDSHSHFSRGWDSVLVDMHHRIGDPMAIITTYPVHYDENNLGHDKSDSYVFPKGNYDMCICRTEQVKVVDTRSFKHTVGRMSRPKKPIRTAFLAAGFNFAPASRLVKVPYDPKTPFLFDGEEMSFGIRAWTHGYDLYHPDKPVCAHLYIRGGSKLRPVFWTENWGVRYKIQYKSTLRINYFLGLHDTFDKNVPLSEIDTSEEEC